MKCDCGAPCDREILVQPDEVLDGMVTIQITGVDSCGEFAHAGIMLTEESCNSLINDIRLAQAMVRYQKSQLQEQENESSVRMLHQIYSEAEIIQACDQHKQNIETLIHKMQEEASKE